MTIQLLYCKMKTLGQLDFLNDKNNLIVMNIQFIGVSAALSYCFIMCYGPSGYVDFCGRAIPGFSKWAFGPNGSTDLTQVKSMYYREEDPFQ